MAGPPPQWALPAHLNDDQGGESNGSFNFNLPRDSREIAEGERDFYRTLLAGGIAVLTPSQFEEVWRREQSPCSSGEVADARQGDVSSEAVQEAIADFRQQLLDQLNVPLPSDADGEGADAAEGFVVDDDARDRLGEAISSGVLEQSLTVGPAMHFVGHANLTPRILQPRFVVVLGPRSLRVATLGFVGEPLLGERPSEKRTPFVACLLTQDLAGCTAEGQEAQISVHYRVQLAGPSATTISHCVSAEVPALLNIATGRAESFRIMLPDVPTQTLLIAGIAIPSTGIQEQEGVTLFLVEVTPADGREPWTVRRRYQQFHDLYCSVRPASNHLASVSFPRKHLRPVVGVKLETRRRGLEVWLSEVVREAQSREPSWMRPLCDFLELQ